MPTFHYQILTPSGRLLKKTQIADSRTDLRSQLVQEGMYVVSISSSRSSSGGLQTLFSRRRFSQKDFLAFNQQLAVLLKAGMPVVQALDTIISTVSPGELNDIVSVLRQEIQGGNSLSQACRQYSHYFSDLYISSIATGEKSGELTQSINRFIAYRKKQAILRQKCIAALIYPALLTAASAGVILFLLLYVIPVFSRIFLESGQRLPMLSLILIQLSRTIIDHWLLLAGTVIGVVLIIRHLLSTSDGQLFRDRLFLALPIAGSFVISFNIANFAQSLATVLRGGTPLVAAIRIARASIGNKELKERITRISDSVETGTGFSSALGDIGSFPTLAVRMIDAGETAGDLESVLSEVADFYGEQVDAKLAMITTLVEPAIMIIMGGMIGIIVMAMYLPIFQLAAIGG